MQELVVLLSDQFEPVGTMAKADVHTGDTPLHRAFSLFIFKPTGELLLQQRSSKKVAFPLVWTNSCCGHPAPDESYENAASRRAAFELGMPDLQPMIAIPDYRYTATMHGIKENEFCPVLTVVTAAEPTPNTEEVEAVRWIPWEDWVHETIEHPENYSPWCVEETALLAKRFPHGHMLDITILAGQEKDALEKFKEEHWLAADEEHYGTNIPNFRKHEYTLIVRDGEKVVGYIYLLVDSDVALIESFLVHTGERRKGIGAALLKRAEEKAAEEGCHVIKLETGVDWHAKEFYEKQGYTLRAHLPNYYGGRDFILMDKRLLK